jgi:hypothetical protein
MPSNRSTAQSAACAQRIFLMSEPPVQTQSASLFARTVIHKIGNRRRFAPKLVCKGQDFESLATSERPVLKNTRVMGNQAALGVSVASYLSASSRWSGLLAVRSGLMQSKNAAPTSLKTVPVLSMW